MRLSCNGCRVLRKACGEDCIIRPCLSWMRNPESQAHATQFLAKFYGRAGLQNLLHAGSPNHRPAIYRSLLYEACGRIINPTFGSVGLLWSGKWELCQAAVEAVLKGLPISQVSSDDLVVSSSSPPSKYPGDIRHAMKAPDQNKLHKISNTTRTKFKRYASKPNDFTEIIESSPSESELCYRPIKDEPEQEEHDQEHEYGQKVEEELEYGQKAMEKPQTTIYLNLGFDQVTRVHNPKMYDVDLNL